MRSKHAFLAGFIAALFLVAALGSGIIIGQEDAGKPVKLPLDLPSGGTGDDEDEEETPETIVFYGGEYEGDAFFWCLDKSCSMAGQKMATLKKEVTTAIDSLSDRSDIGLVAFSQNYVQWRTSPQRTVPTTKVAAKTWVYTLHASGGTIISPAGVAMVNMCNASSKSKKTMIVVGDGIPGDPSAGLQNITAANYQRTPINTILIGGAGVSFMQTLAEMNNGSFRRTY